MTDSLAVVTPLTLAEIDFAMDSTHERRAPELPLGRSETIRRYVDEMRERRSREGQALMPPPSDEDALGWAGYFELAYDAGLLEPRPREGRPPMGPPASGLHAVK